MNKSNNIDWNNPIEVKKYKKLSYKLWRENNLEYDKLRHKVYNEEHKKEIKEYNEQYGIKNKDKKLVCSTRYYYNHKDNISLKNKKNYFGLKIKVLSYYSKGLNPCCICCGISDEKYLCLDHIDGGGTLHREKSDIKNMIKWVYKNNFPDGFQVMCYNCNFSKGTKKFCIHKRKINIESVASNQIYYINTKYVILKRYSNNMEPFCICCGETELEFLTIDHINGGGRKHFKKIGGSGVIFYRWLIQNNFPHGFQVLCMGCNYVKHIYGECKHVDQIIVGATSSALKSTISFLSNRSTD